MTYEDWMNEVRQKAFELGGLEDGSYHLEDDELEEIIKLTLYRQAEPAPAQDEQQPVVVPQCVRDWYDAKKAHIAAVDAYNARLAFVREHEPFGTSVDPEYQIMVDAERKVRDLLVPLFIGLTDYLAAPIAPATQPEQSGKFAIGDRVKKTSGSEWQGRICGTYSTALTTEGYAYAKADARSDIQNLEAACDGYRDDARVLHAALERMVAMYEHEFDHENTSKWRPDWLRDALSRTNALQGEQP